MKALILLLATLAVSSGFPQKQREVKIVDIGGKKAITEINKGHDDIKRPLNSAIIDQMSRWTPPVHYSFGANLDMNTKGVFLRALNEFRLKSCIDFKEWDKKETYYIKVIKSTGCWSYVGQYMENGQELSLGKNCDTIATAEHEIMHALGFLHEQSRYDRDDYVTINFTNIIEGMENNFDKGAESLFTTHNTLYDYWSVMHYGLYAFSNGNGPTIIPKDQRYMNIIGQDFGLSTSDLLELNLLYQCESSIAYMQYCSFTNDQQCPITTCSKSSMSWEKVTQVIGGPSSDHTSLPSGNPEAPEENDEMSYFMHVNTANGQEGDSAWLGTKRMSPKRACNTKCLQFYYYHSDSESDDLNIWIREFEDEMDLKGHRRLLERIWGPRTRHWQIKYVPISTSRSFQVEFEVRKGALPATGGISIDDINLSEIQCPHATLQINNFQQILMTSDYGYTIYSPIYYSYTGYAYSFGVIMSGSHIGAFVQLVSGKHDNNLTWPVPDTQVTLQMVDQSPNFVIHMSNEGSFISDLSVVENGSYVWGKPTDHGDYYIDNYNQTIYYGPMVGFSYFASLDNIRRKNFLKGGSAVFNIFFEDISPLKYIDELPCPPAGPLDRTHDEYDNGPCSPKTTTAEPPHTTDDTSTHPTKTTKDKSVFGFAASKISSPVLIFLTLLMLFMQ